MEESEDLEANVTVVLHGFMNLKMKEKLRLVNEMNRYFDEVAGREQIREENAARFRNIDIARTGCKCCGR